LLPQDVNHFRAKAGDVVCRLRLKLTQVIVHGFAAATKLR
jgi:hypothetical protein